MPDASLEQQLLCSIDGDEMFQHLERICAWDRLSGGPGEAAAIDYLAEVLKGYGLPVTIHQFDAYLSNPISGALSVDGHPIAAKTRAFSATAENVAGELVYVPGSRDMFKDTETRKLIEQLDLTGKIVLTEGGGRSNMIAAQARGAVGFIHMWPSDEPYIHEGTVSPVWGTPTPESYATLPRIPVIQITQGDGEALQRRIAAGARVSAVMSARTETSWTQLRLPVTEVKGATDEFVLIAGHIDSWYYGVTDNGTGNVACLEIARAFQRLGPQLHRGVRIAWWPGHSNGRYAGSTWYADHFWQDLREHCVGYINIDSPGPQGATDYSLITAVAENAQFLCGLVSELTGQQVQWERPVRAGDQSFWGAGVTSAYMLLSNRPEGQRAAVGGCGLGWWWHTEEDTMDKADKAVLVLDTQIYALTALRLCQAVVLPYDLGAVTAEFATEVQRLGQLAGPHLDLSPVQAAIDSFRAAWAAFAATAPNPSTYNRALLHALRELTVVNYTVTGPFEHDAAVPAKPIPGLQGAAALAGLDPSENDFGFHKTRLIRERNRICHAFAEAAVACHCATHS